MGNGSVPMLKGLIGALQLVHCSQMKQLFLMGLLAYAQRPGLGFLIGGLVVGIAAGEPTTYPVPEKESPAAEHLPVSHSTAAPALLDVSAWDQCIFAPRYSFALVLMAVRLHVWELSYLSGSPVNCQCLPQHSCCFRCSYMCQVGGMVACMIKHAGNWYRAPGVWDRIDGQPRQLPTAGRAHPMLCRSLGFIAAGRLHNLAHVELNAVDLAMDSVARFAHLGLPVQFYTDFLHIADDEARHFGEPPPPPTTPPFSPRRGRTHTHIHTLCKQFAAVCPCPPPRPFFRLMAPAQA